MSFLLAREEDRWLLWSSAQPTRRFGVFSRFLQETRNESVRALLTRIDFERAPQVGYRFITTIKRDECFRADDQRHREVWSQFNGMRQRRDRFAVAMQPV